MSKDNESKRFDRGRLRAALELYDNSPCGSISFQDDGLITDLNSTLSNWLGYDKKELIHKRTLPSLFKIGGQIFFETHFFPLIKMQGFIKEVYFDIVRKDKSILHCLINVREIQATGNQPTNYQGTILDISDRWQYEAEILKAKRKAEADSKAKADFLATISHEIRTPLNSILGIGNLLHQTPLNENQKEYARLLLHSSEHLLSLVNNLLDLSKIEANKIQLEQKPFNLYDLADVLKHTFSVKAQQKSIDLHLNLDERVPQNLLGDPVKLKQVLTNLVGNAIKFTKEGHVSISITLVKEYKKSVLLLFEVTDTGIGIPEEKLEAIFHEFSQASYDVSVEFGGTGLGLTISKKILELHKSNLDVSSSLNSGSTFSFNIRYKKYGRELDEEEKVSAASRSDNFKNINVLVVDDNTDNIFIAAQYLEQWNINYMTADSGYSAISLCETTNFDVILLDLQMPKMNGYETAEEIRKRKTEKKPTIVAFSASAKGEVQQQLLKAGIDDYLPKPFQPQHLYETLVKYQNIDEPKQLSNISDQEKLVENKSKKPKFKSKKKPAVSASFSLTRYKKMAKNKPEYLRKFRLSTLDALISYQKDFKKAIKKRDIEQLSNLIHTSTMSLYYIQADNLSELLKECRTLLRSTPVNEQSLSSSIEECNEEFKKIIEGLKKE